MNHTLFLSVVAAIGLSAACSHPAAHPGLDASPASAAASPGTASAPGSLAVRSNLLTASRGYAFALDGEQYYCILSASAESPVEIGSASLAALADTLVGAAFPSCRGLAMEEAVDRWLADTAGLFPAPAQRVDIGDVPPASPRSWSVDTRIARLALTPRYVTYAVATSSYLGGAHPNTVVTPVTYDLSAGRPVTPSMLFVKGSGPTLIKAISTELASRLGCEPDHLSRGGLFTDTIGMPSGMYVDSNRILVFQYGQYEIGPYSMGIITVPVAPESVSDILTPAGRSLLIE